VQFIADENFPGPAVTALRAAGHDVAWVRSERPGVGDVDVLAWAVRDERILLTFDKDFGELAMAAALPRACGLVLFRLRMPRREDVGRLIASIIDARNDWAGNISVVEPGRVRVRPLS
jgi:predicted nuclease of predicted toxin-antitoxin system